MARAPRLVASDREKQTEIQRNSDGNAELEPMRINSAIVASLCSLSLSTQRARSATEARLRRSRPSYIRENNVLPFEELVAVRVIASRCDFPLRRHTAAPECIRGVHRGSILAYSERLARGPGTLTALNCQMPSV